MSGIDIAAAGGLEGGTIVPITRPGDEPGPIKDEARGLPDPRKAKPRRLVSLADFAPRVKVSGGAIPTPFETLNTEFRGGIRPGGLYGFNGQPGAGKTGLVLNIADHAERQGHPVINIMQDERAEGGAMRFYQMAGGERDDLERDDPKGEYARAKARELAEGRRIYFADTTIAVEDAVDEFLKIAGEGTPYVIADSIQSLVTKAGYGLDNPRERINANLGVLKQYANRGAVVIFTSEMSRQGYRGGRDGNIDALAAGKESGSIEYTVDALIALRPDKAMRGFVNAEIAKNRMGGLAEFRLRLDFQTARMTEVAMPDRDASEEAREAAKLNEIAAKIAKKVRTSKTPIKSRNQLWNVMGGNKAALLRAVDRLVDEGRLEMTPAGFQWLDEEAHDDD